MTKSKGIFLDLFSHATGCDVFYFYLIDGHIADDVEWNTVYRDRTSFELQRYVVWVWHLEDAFHSTAKSAFMFRDIVMTHFDNHNLVNWPIFTEYITMPHGARIVWDILRLQATDTSVEQICQKLQYKLKLYLGLFCFVFVFVFFVCFCFFVFLEGGNYTSIDNNLIAIVRTFTCRLTFCMLCNNNSNSVNFYWYSISYEFNKHQFGKNSRLCLTFFLGV